MTSEIDLVRVVKAIQKVLPADRTSYPLHEPEFSGNESRYVNDCITSGWVSSVGEYVVRFEEDLARVTGSPFAVATVNGTAALHLCLKLAGVLPGDEVLLPALTFVATANAVTYCDAIPHFVDSAWTTLGMNVTKLRDYLAKTTENRPDGLFNKISKRRIKAVIPVHTFGHCVDLDPLKEMCDDLNLELIEDAAESLGSYYKGRHTGTIAKLSALSFNGNKIITTGGGGAVLTSDENLAKAAKHISSTAKMPHPWDYSHDQIGYNYRLPNLNAALGCAQLERLNSFISRKRLLALKYARAFQNVEGVKIFLESKNSRSNYWLNVLILDKKHSHQRDELLQMTHARKILARPAWQLLSQLPMFQNAPKMDLSGAEEIAERIINLPSSASLLGHEET